MHDLLIGLPTAMNFPAVNDLTVFKNIEMGVLGGGHARMICQNSDTIADRELIEPRRSVCPNLAVFLRYACYEHTCVVSIKAKDASITAQRIQPNRTTVFRKSNTAGIDNQFAPSAIFVHDSCKHGQ